MMVGIKPFLLKLLLVFGCQILLFSCGEGVPVPAKKSRVDFSPFQKTSGKYIHPSLPGGMAIWGSGGNDDEAFSLINSNQFTQDFIYLTAGYWGFHFVGWEGEWLQGNVRCGKGFEELLYEEEEVTIDVSSSECANEDFAPPAYLIDGRFKTLRFITCKDISNAVANGNCDGVNEKGASGSYKVQVAGYPPSLLTNIFMPFTPAIESRCIAGSSGTDSATRSEIKVPFGRPGMHGFGVRIFAYESTDCSGWGPTVLNFDFVAGLLNGASKAAVFAGEITADIFLTHPQSLPPGVINELQMYGPSVGEQGECLGPFTITAVDSIYVPVNDHDDLLLALSYSGVANLQDGAFYGDEYCATSPIIQRSILRGSSSTQIYFKKASNDVGVTLVADLTEGGSASGSTTLNITGLPTKLTLSGPSGGSVNSCLGPYTVSLSDSANNPVVIANPISVSLSGISNSTNAPNGYFYWGTDSSCSGGTFTSMSLAINTSGLNFYFKGVSSGEITLKASASGYSDATLGVVTTSAGGGGGGSRNYIVINGPATGHRYDCLSFTAQLMDAANNPLPVALAMQLMLSYTGMSGSFHDGSDVYCVYSPISYIWIPANLSSSAFRFKPLPLTSGNTSISAFNSAVTTIPLTVTITY